MPGRAMLGVAFWALMGCFAPPRPVRVELKPVPATLSHTPQAFAAGEPLPSEGGSVSVCVHPAPGHQVTGRWTVLTPDGHEAQVVAHAELVDGKVVRLASPSSTGSRLCVHPRLEGPLEAPVRRVRVTASAPIVVERVVWQSTAP